MQGNAGIHEGGNVSVRSGVRSVRSYRSGVRSDRGVVCDGLKLSALAAF